MTDDLKDRLLDAILLHVPFDGWSEAAFRAACADCGVEPSLARTVCPRGAVDLAVAQHHRGDEEMVRRIRAEPLHEMRFRDRVAAAVRFRLEAVEDKEVVRRASALFALPLHAADGARLIWGTADRIWEVLGDTSEDINWYTKRASLSTVYGATVLYWLGDDTPGHAATWEFLDRRIENVMAFEKAKARVRAHPVLGRIVAGPERLLSKVRPPSQMRRFDLPGIWRGRGPGSEPGPENG